MMTIVGSMNLLNGCLFEGYPRILRGLCYENLLAILDEGQDVVPFLPISLSE